VGGGRGGRGGRGSTPGDAPIAAPNNQMPPANQAPADEWDRYYALNVMDPSARPVLLTTTDGLIENQTSIAVSADGKTFYYCTNAKDIERRHIWAVPTGGGTPAQITAGEGVETYPAPLASGKYLATLSASWNIPQSLGVWKLGTEASAGPAPAQKIIFPTSRPGFPMDAHVKPETIITKAPDGLEIHNQVFLPKDLKAGERRPAIVFVHGGPQRQMMPAYHYMQFYHWAYGINQWLANQGYIVMSINYRSGIGYGRSFRMAPNTGGAGNSEYQDVVAGAKYLENRPDVDQTESGSGACRMAAYSRHKPWRATPTSSKRESTVRACTCGAARSIPRRSPTSPRRLARSMAGSRRCCSSRATTTAMWRSSR
jgi:dipeptidyl-peptidase-4